MKDIIIKPKHLKRELLVLLALIVLVYLANIYAISAYNTPWSELTSSIGYVICIGLVLYGILGLFRSLIFLVWKLAGK